MNDSILVCISSCDKIEDIEKTINSCIDFADSSDKIYFSVCWHDIYNQKKIIQKNNVNFFSLNFNGIVPTGYSRSLSIFVPSYKTEYVLQIDGHTIFTQNWDKKLINSFKQIKKYSNNFIISGYLPWWYEKNNKIFSQDDEEIKDLKQFSQKENFMFPMDISTNKDIEYPFCIGSAGKFWITEKYCEHFFVSGHFYFGKSQDIFSVIPDPQMIHGVDELLMGIRFFCKNYEIFSIKENIAWHKNKLGDHKDLFDWRLNSHQNNFYDINKKIYLEKTKQILTGKYFGELGFLDEDYLRKYENMIEFSFKDFYKKKDR